MIEVFVFYSDCMTHLGFANEETANKFFLQEGKNEAVICIVKTVNGACTDSWHKPNDEDKPKPYTGTVRKP